MGKKGGLFSKGHNRPMNSYGGKAMFRSDRDATIINTEAYERKIDAIANNNFPPVLLNGVFNLYGKDSHVGNHLRQFDSNNHQQYMQTPAINQMMTQPMYQEMAFDSYYTGGSPQNNAEGYGQNYQQNTAGGMQQ